MSDHPGDTLGKRFLTFWGGLIAIAAVGGGLLLYRWVFLPSDDADPDPAGTKRRGEIVKQVNADQAALWNKVAEVEPGKTVSLPPDRLIDWAAARLASQKAAPGPIKTPEAQIRDAAPAAPAAGTK